VSLIEVVPATMEHVEAMAPRMRRADVEEVWAANRSNPYDALRSSLALSWNAWAGVVDGVVMCIFGVTPLSLVTGCGVPWMLGATGLERYAMAFLRRNRRYVAEMLATFPRLENWVDARNGASIRWLRWLGFTLEPAAPWGAFGLPFHRFSMGA
jgi:hypothetical protein